MVVDGSIDGSASGADVAGEVVEGMDVGGGSAVAVFCLNDGDDEG